MDMLNPDLPISHLNSSLVTSAGSEADIYRVHIRTIPEQLESPDRTQFPCTDLSTTGPWNECGLHIRGRGCCQWRCTHPEMSVYSRESRLGEVVCTPTTSTVSESSLELTCFLLTRALNDLQSTDSYHYHRGFRGQVCPFDVDRKYC